MSNAKGARGRRFEGGLSPDASEVNASIGFDYRLLPHDVAGSTAHARMLARQGLITESDATAIAEGLARVAAKLESGELSYDEALEDVHMNVEARLIEDIGDAGRRLHTGRSRNDQVATDLRLYARAQAALITERIADLRRALLLQAEAHLDTFMPGYTHLQRAQPVRLAHHLLAYDAMLVRDRDRIADASRRAGASPLGSGALAGTTLPIDRESVARDLGFDSVTVNSLDAVGDRDFAVELVGALALMQVHLSRLGEELVLWLSQEFKFARMSEAFCSGSSLMPQKMNPDLAEIIRARAGRVMGDWITLMTVIKGLPLAYNKDLQETQEPLYDAVETAESSLRVAAGMIENVVFDVPRLRAAVDSGYLVATEVADYLVSKGIAFREAHDVAGALVRTAIEKGVELSGLTVQELKEEHPIFESDISDWLDIARAVDRRNLVGGPARNQVATQLARVRAELFAPS